MPWSQTSPMDQRTQFIADYLRILFRDRRDPGIIGGTEITQFLNHLADNHNGAAAQSTGRRSIALDDLTRE